MGILLLSFLQLADLDANRDQNIDFWINQLDSESVDLNINAIEKMAELQDPKALSYLASALRTAGPEVRFHIAKALSRFPTEAVATQILGPAQAAEKDVYIKAEINRSIRFIRDYLNKQQEKLRGEP